jgi:DNA invertase Pin-like site-specific DNA recombinase
MDLKEYVARRGYEIFNFCEDIVSGATKERKALDQLFQDAKHRKFDIVLVWKFDRFARSLKMLVDSLVLFQELGIDFISTRKILTPQRAWDGSSSILTVPTLSLSGKLSGIGS